MTTEILLAVVGLSLLSLLGAVILAGMVFSQKKGDRKLQAISDLITEGANSFMKRQYSTILLIALAFAVLIYVIYAVAGNTGLGWRTSAAFIFGSASSAVAGIISMMVSIRANVRVAAAATDDNYPKALVTALRSGAISGITIVAMSLLGISLLFLVFGLDAEVTSVPFMLVGYGFGASFVALFAQLGGGIYTKAADVGADLVGKIEKGIPEDDPRNPAVIADLVGDNVGDCAGRGADLFESIAAENIGAMIIGVALFSTFGVQGILFPLLAGSIGLVASLIGVFFVYAKNAESPMKALNRGYVMSAIIVLVAFYFLIDNVLGELMFFVAALIGVVTSALLVLITMYYTESKFRPVQSIVKASTSGPATNIIAGFSAGLESTVLPAIILSVSLVLSYIVGSSTGVHEGGIYGTAIATIGMLATAGFILAMDNFGPITDNAGGIVEMSGGDQKARAITDKLDAAGNTTKAITKGYAIGSAALAAFLLFSAYLQVIAIGGYEAVVNLADIKVFVGGFLGAMLVLWFSSLAIRAVGTTAQTIVEEVRRQFRDIEGIMTGKGRPDYGACVDIAAKAALKEMVAPGLIVFFVVLLVGKILGPYAAAAVLMVGTITGILFAMTFNNSGGAWDNAKKYIESGNLGGKGSDAHKAAVVGDTVGDPFKDTAGPSLHVLIKLLGTITLVLAPIFL